MEVIIRNLRVLYQSTHFNDHYLCSKHFITINHFTQVTIIRGTPLGISLFFYDFKQKPLTVDIDQQIKHSDPREVTA